MSSAAAASLFRHRPPELLRPPSSDNPRVGLAASMVAHVLLVAALALGVRWRNVETDVPVAAELWAAAPQLAPAPQAVSEPPPPQPVTRAQPTPPPPTATPQRDADIAIEKAKERQAKLKAEQDEKQAKREKEKADKAEADRKQAEKAAKEEKAAEAQREKLRQQQLQRLNAQLGGNGGGGGSAAQEAGPSAGYAGRIKARILPNIVLTEDVQGNPTAEVEVTVAADGSIIGRRIVKKSGSAAWDDAVLRAIDKTAILPRDTDGRVPPRMVLAFRPKD